MTETSEVEETLPIILNKITQGEKRISYKLIKVIGKGGFAIVFYAEQLSDIDAPTPIAVKRIAKSRISGPKARKKIVSEIEIHRSLSHNSIVQYNGVFQDASYVYILQEYCPNGSVSEELKKLQMFSEDKTQKVVHQLLEGIRYLHSMRIIHRDIKLQNLLYDAQYNIKLCDFGLSAQITEEDEKRMTVCGTAGFLSPEVISSEYKGHSYEVDIWAVGVCTFLMLTGKQPFQAPDKKSTFRKISKVDYTWPDTPKVSDKARRFVDSILQRDPSQRPSISDLFQTDFLNDTIPSNHVKMYWDYSHRYGMAYLLENHICGACFNDSSRIVLSADETFCQYFDAPHSEVQIVEMNEVTLHTLKKKLLLILHFAQELKQYPNDFNSPPFIAKRKDEILPHVKYWAKTKEGVLFRMASRDVQAIFKDHSRLIIETMSRSIYYENGDKFEILSISDLKNKEQHSEARKRFSLIKDMSNFLI